MSSILDQQKPPGLPPPVFQPRGYSTAQYDPSFLSGDGITLCKNDFSLCDTVLAVPLHGATVFKDEGDNALNAEECVMNLHSADPTNPTKHFVLSHSPKSYIASSMGYLKLGLHITQTSSPTLPVQSSTTMSLADDHMSIDSDVDHSTHRHNHSSQQPPPPTQPALFTSHEFLLIPYLRPVLDIRAPIFSKQLNNSLTTAKQTPNIQTLLQAEFNAHFPSILQYPLSTSSHATKLTAEPTTAERPTVISRTLTPSTVSTQSLFLSSLNPTSQSSHGLTNFPTIIPIDLYNNFPTRQHPQYPNCVIPIPPSSLVLFFEYLCLGLFHPSKNISSLVGLYYFANIFQITKLSTLLLSHFHSTLTTSSLINILYHGPYLDDKLLQQCYGFLDTNVNTIIRSSDFLQFPVELVYLMFSRQTCNIYNELDVFKAIVMWSLSNISRGCFRLYVDGKTIGIKTPHTRKSTPPNTLTNVAHASSYTQLPSIVQNPTTLLATGQDIVGGDVFDPLVVNQYQTALKTATSRSTTNKTPLEEASIGLPPRPALQITSSSSSCYKIFLLEEIIMHIQQSLTNVDVPQKFGPTQDEWAMVLTYISRLSESPSSSSSRTPKTPTTDTPTSNSASPSSSNTISSRQPSHRSPSSHDFTEMGDYQHTNPTRDNSDEELSTLLSPIAQDVESYIAKLQSQHESQQMNRNSEQSLEQQNNSQTYLPFSQAGLLKLIEPNFTQQQQQQQQQQQAHSTPTSLTTPALSSRSSHGPPTSTAASTASLSTPSNTLINSENMTSILDQTTKNRRRSAQSGPAPATATSSTSSNANSTTTSDMPTEQLSDQACIQSVNIYVNQDSQRSLADPSRGNYAKLGGDLSISPLGVFDKNNTHLAFQYLDPILSQEISNIPPPTPPSSTPNESAPTQSATAAVVSNQSTIYGYSQDLNPHDILQSICDQFAAAAAVSTTPSAFAPNLYDVPVIATKPSSFRPQFSSNKPHFHIHPITTAPQFQNLQIFTSSSNPYRSSSNHNAFNQFAGDNDEYHTICTLDKLYENNVEFASTLSRWNALHETVIAQLVEMHRSNPQHPYHKLLSQQQQPAQPYHLLDLTQDMSDAPTSAQSTKRKSKLPPTTTGTPATTTTTTTTGTAAAGSTAASSPSTILSSPPSPPLLPLPPAPATPNQEIDQALYLEVVLQNSIELYKTIFPYPLHNLFDSKHNQSSQAVGGMKMRDLSAAESQIPPFTDTTVFDSLGEDDFREQVESGINSSGDDDDLVDESDIFIPSYALPTPYPQQRKYFDLESDHDSYDSQHAPGDVSDSAIGNEEELFPTGPQKRSRSQFRPKSVESATAVADHITTFRSIPLLSDDAFERIRKAQRDPLHTNPFNHMNINNAPFHTFVPDDTDNHLVPTTTGEVVSSSSSSSSVPPADSSSTTTAMTTPLLPAEPAPPTRPTTRQQPAARRSTRTTTIAATTAAAAAATTTTTPTTTPTTPAPVTTTTTNTNPTTAPTTQTTTPTLASVSTPVAPRTSPFAPSLNQLVQLPPPFPPTTSFLQHSLISHPLFHTPFGSQAIPLVAPYPLVRDVHVDPSPFSQLPFMLGSRGSRLIPSMTRPHLPPAQSAGRTAPTPNNNSFQPLFTPFTAHQFLHHVANGPQPTGTRPISSTPNPTSAPTTPTALSSTAVATAFNQAQVRELSLSINPDHPLPAYIYSQADADRFSGGALTSDTLPLTPPLSQLSLYFQTSLAFFLRTGIPDPILVHNDPFLARLYSAHLYCRHTLLNTSTTSRPRSTPLAPLPRDQLMLVSSTWERFYFAVLVQAYRLSLQPDTLEQLYFMTETTARSFKSAPRHTLPDGTFVLHWAVTSLLQDAKSFEHPSSLSSRNMTHRNANPTALSSTSSQMLFPSVFSLVEGLYSQLIHVLTIIADIIEPHTQSLSQTLLTTMLTSTPPTPPLAYPQHAVSVTVPHHIPRSPPLSRVCPELYLFLLSTSYECDAIARDALRLYSNPSASEHSSIHTTHHQPPFAVFPPSVLLNINNHLGTSVPVQILDKLIPITTYSLCARLPLTYFLYPNDPIHTEVLRYLPPCPSPLFSRAKLAMHSISNNIFYDIPELVNFPLLWELYPILHPIQIIANIMVTILDRYRLTLNSLLFELAATYGLKSLTNPAAPASQLPQNDSFEATPAYQSFSDAMRRLKTYDRSLSTIPKASFPPYFPDSELAYRSICHAPPLGSNQQRSTEPDLAHFTTHIAYTLPTTPSTLPSAEMPSVQEYAIDFERVFISKDILQYPALPTHTFQPQRLSLFGIPITRTFPPNDIRELAKISTRLWALISFAVYKLFISPTPDFLRSIHASYPFIAGVLSSSDNRPSPGLLTNLKQHSKDKKGTLPINFNRFGLHHVEEYYSTIIDPYLSLCAPLTTCILSVPRSPSNPATSSSTTSASSSLPSTAPTVPSTTATATTTTTTTGRGKKKTSTAAALRAAAADHEKIFRATTLLIDPLDASTTTSQTQTHTQTAQLQAQPQPTSTAVLPNQSILVPFPLNSFSRSFDLSNFFGQFFKSTTPLSQTDQFFFLTEYSTKHIFTFLFAQLIPDTEVWESLLTTYIDNRRRFVPFSTPNTPTAQQPSHQRHAIAVSSHPPQSTFHPSSRPPTLPHLSHTTDNNNQPGQPASNSSNTVINANANSPATTVPIPILLDALTNAPVRLLPLSLSALTSPQRPAAIQPPPNPIPAVGSVPTSTQRLSSEHVDFYITLPTLLEYISPLDLLRLVINPLLFTVRFPLLTPHEFSTVVAPLKLTLPGSLQTIIHSVQYPTDPKTGHLTTIQENGTINEQYKALIETINNANNAASGTKSDDPMKLLPPTIVSFFQRNRRNDFYGTNEVVQLPIPAQLHVKIPSYMYTYRSLVFQFPHVTASECILNPTRTMVTNTTSDEASITTSIPIIRKENDQRIITFVMHVYELDDSLRKGFFGLGVTDRAWTFEKEGITSKRNATLYYCNGWLSSFGATLDKSGDVSSWGVGHYVGIRINLGNNTIHFMLNGVNVGPCISIHQSMMAPGKLIYPVVRLKPRSTVAIVGSF